MAKEKDNNLQYLRTDRAIINAFYDLLDVKPFDKITVQNILDMALVSRSTFYQHYRDKYDIVEHLFANFKETFHYFLDTNFVVNAQKFSMSNQIDLIDKLGMQNYTKYFLENKRLLGALFKIHTDDINLDSFLYNFYQEKYLDNPVNKARPARDDMKLRLESEIYASIQSALGKFIHHDIKTIDSVSLETQDLLFTCVLRVSAYLIGIRSEDYIQMSVENVKSVKELAVANSGNYSNIP